MKNLLFFVLLLIVVFISSCKTIKYVNTQYEVLHPAYYTLPNNIDTILVVSTIEPDTLRDWTVLYSNDEELEEMYKIKSLMPGITCNTVLEDINKSGYLALKIEYKTWKKEDLFRKCDSLCRANNANALLVLSKYNYSTTLNTQKNRYDQYVCILKSSVETQFSLSMPNGASKQFETRNDTLEWTRTSLSSEYSEAIEALPNLDEKYTTTALYVGHRFANQIVPMWDTATRVIISASTKRMTDAISWVKFDNWEEAKNLWDYVYNNGPANEKALAAINIGVYYDRLDKATEASMWYSAAIDVLQQNKDKKSIAEIIDIAEKQFKMSVDRIKEKEILDKQMN